MFAGNQILGCGRDAMEDKRCRGYCDKTNRKSQESYNWSTAMQEVKSEELFGVRPPLRDIHNNDVIMGAVASQITSLTIVYSTVDSDADQRKHQSSASLAFGCGIHRGPGNSPHKWPVALKMFPCDDVIMIPNIGRLRWWGLAGVYDSGHLYPQMRYYASLETPCNSIDFLGNKPGLVTEIFVTIFKHLIRLVKVGWHTNTTVYLYQDIAFFRPILPFALNHN